MAAATAAEFAAIKEAFPSYVGEIDRCLAMASLLTLIGEQMNAGLDCLDRDDCAIVAEGADFRLIILGYTP